MGGGASLVLPSPCPTTRMITASFFPLLKLWDRCAKKLLYEKIRLTKQIVTYTICLRKSIRMFGSLMKKGVIHILQKVTLWMVSSFVAAMMVCLCCGKAGAVMITQDGARQRLSDMGIESYDYPEVLNVAAESGDASSVRLLIAAGADVNKSSRIGAREYLHPLSLASDRQHWDIVRMLVDAGANVNVTWADCSPLDDAISVQNADMVAFLLAHGAVANPPSSHKDDAPPLQMAVNVGNVEIARLLLEHGADVNYTRTWDNPHDSRRQWVLMTPLQVECEKEALNPDMIRLLLSHGATASWGDVWRVAFEVPTSLWWDVFLAYPRWWVIMIAVLAAVALPVCAFIYSRKS